MLDNLRDFGKTWLGKILGAFLLVGLAGFGVSGVITGFGGNTVARVGSEEISTMDFQRAYNAQLNATAQRTGAIPTAEEAMARGIPSAAINRLAADAALNGLGKEFGLGASDERLGIMLRDDPNFAGTLGNFDETSFQRALQLNGFTENEYFDSQTDAARRQQIISALFGDVDAPEAALTLINRYGSDERVINFFVLRADSILPPEAPTDEEMRAYLADNQARYRTIPTRTTDVMVLTPEAVAEGLGITETDIAAEYERTKANYTKVETRDISQVILSTDDAVAQFRAGIEAGKSFNTLVAEASLSVTDLGTLTQAEILDPALAEPTFALEVGEVVILPAILGQRAVTVTNIVPGGQQTLDEVRDQITQRVKNRLGRDGYVDVLDQIEELRAAFRPLSEIAGRYQLDVVEVPVTASGQALSEIEAIPADGYARVASAIFNADPESLAPTVALNANLNVWFDIERVAPARDQTLDEVRDAINTAMLDERSADALIEQVEGIVAHLETGESIDDVGLTVGQFPQLSAPFNRGGSDAVIDSAVASSAFSGGPDFFGSAQNGNGDYVIFHVEEVAQSEEDAQQAARDFVNNAVVDSLYNDFLTALRDSAGVRINQGVLQQVLALDGGQQHSR